MRSSCSENLIVPLAIAAASQFGLASAATLRQAVSATDTVDLVSSADAEQQSPQQALRDAHAEFIQLAEEQLVEIGFPVSTNADDLLTHAVNSVIFVLVLVVLAWITVHTCYKRGPPERNPSTQSVDPEVLFKEGHFSCFQDSEVCLCACICTAIRWADTMNNAGQLAFWGGFILFAFAQFFSCLAFGYLYSPFGIFTLIAMLYFRHKLREKFRLEPWTFKTCFFDFCFICWCPCCAVAQEARVVNEAYKDKPGKWSLEPVVP